MPLAHAISICFCEYCSIDRESAPIFWREGVRLERRHTCCFAGAHPRREHMVDSKNIELIASTSTASARARLAIFTLLALAPLGCTVQSGDEAQADGPEHVGESSEALTPAYLPPSRISVPVAI